MLTLAKCSAPRQNMTQEAEIAYGARLCLGGRNRLCPGHFLRRPRLEQRRLPPSLTKLMLCQACIAEKKSRQQPPQQDLLEEGPVFVQQAVGGIAGGGLHIAKQEVCHLGHSKHLCITADHLQISVISMCAYFGL